MKIKGNIKSVSPLHIGGEKQSNLTPIAKISMGEKEFPYIPGNSIRGLLRRLLVEDIFNQLGIESISEDEYFFHFVGGALSSSSSTSDMGKKRDLFMNLPHIRFFGTSYENETIAGKLVVSHAIPEDSETEFFQMTRKDDSDVVLNNIKVEGESETDATQQMIFYIEAIPSKKNLTHSFFIHQPTELDLSIMTRIVELLQQKPYIGGMSARGFGEIEVDYEGLTSSDKYFEFLSENKEKIIELSKWKK